MTSAAAVFIDKDGTLIDDVPYNVDPARVTFAPHALEALGRLARAGWLLVVVSNQPGLAIGRFTRDAFDRLRRDLERRLREEGGVELADFLICPHAPATTSPSGPACACRKPAPGMLLQAAAAHGIDLAASWMVGDILNDVEAGRRAGCRTLLLDVGNETEWLAAPDGSDLRTPHHVCADWRQVAELILADGSRPRSPAAPAAAEPAAAAAMIARAYGSGSGSAPAPAPASASASGTVTAAATPAATACSACASPALLSPWLAAASGPS